MFYMVSSGSIVSRRRKGTPVQDRDCACSCNPQSQHLWLAHYGQGTYATAWMSRQKDMTYTMWEGSLA